MGYIYGLVCPLVNEIRYIGQTKKNIDTRLSEHLRESKYNIKSNKKLTHKENWLKILINLGIIEKVKVILIEECNDLDEREIYWIAFYKKINKITNTMIGGVGDRIYSEEYKKTLSEQRKGSGNPMYGKKFQPSDIIIEKRRVAMIKSQKFQDSRKSVGFKKKISDFWSIPVYVLNVDLTIFMEFKNSTECADYFGYTRGNIKNAIREKRMIGKGKKTKYWVVRKEDYNG